MAPFSLLRRQDNELVVPALLVSLFIGTGMYVGSLSFQKARPGIQKAPQTAAQWTGQTVTARLWEDPFVAADKEIGGFLGQQSPSDDGKAPSKSDEKVVRPPSPEKVSKECLKRGAGNRSGPIIILPVFVPGGGYPENGEQRLRMRYAVTAALAVRHYAPNDPEHVGLLTLSVTATHARATGEPGTKEPSPKEPPPSYQIPVPFEWYRPQEASATETDSRILILWISDQDVPGAKMVELFPGILEVVKDALGNRSITTTVIGPYDSDDLVELERSLRSLPASDTPALKDVGFVTATATIPNSDINEVLGTPASQTLQVIKRLGLRRTITTDDQLTKLLADELAYRGVEPQSAHGRVVLVSEWDTSYSRRLAKSLRAAIESRVSPCKPLGEVSTYWNRYTYFRGVDGFGDFSAGKEGAPASAPSEQTGSPGLVPHARSSTEKAATASQLDYVRRLADRVYEDEQVFGKRLGAVGVVGSDVYDKLLILQALRVRFPGVVFFTTDLDARLLEPSQFEWTKNLVVASGYDLRLSSALQMYAPTFRDTYQTALLVAVCGAVPDADQTLARREDPLRYFDAGSLRGHVYEVGRAGQVDLTPHSGDPRLYPSRPPDALALTIRDHKGCFFGACFVIIVLLSLVATMIDLRDRENEFRICVRTSVTYVVISVIALLIVGFVIWRMESIASEPTDDQEPFAWFQGISAWPSILMRIVAGLLALAYCGLLLKRWEDNFVHIAKHFGLPLRAAYVRPTSLLMLCSQIWASRRRLLPCTWKCPRASANDPVIVDELWTEYAARGHPMLRLARTVCMTAVFYGLYYLLFNAIQSSPSPIRGASARAWHHVTVQAAPIAITFLVVLVWDAICLCDRMIRHVGGMRASYSSDTKKVAREETGFRGQAASSWLSVTIIGARTAIIGRSIYYPLLTILILVLSRNSRFDDWHWSPPAAIVILLTTGIALLSAWTLDRSAGFARGKELGRLQQDKDQIAHRPAAESPWAKRSIRIFKDAIRLIEDNRLGAFNPIRSQPIVNAVIGPAGGIALITLLDYLMSYL